MSDQPQNQSGVQPKHEQDQLLQATCEMIVTLAADAVDAEAPSRQLNLKLPDGPVVGRQIFIDATEKGGGYNTCRISVLDTGLAPAGEATRLEYEHDRQTKFGMERVYSIQSVRKRGGNLILLENFLANTARDVREEDFRPIHSESYAQETVLKTLQDWARYRKWQLQQGKK